MKGGGELFVSGASLVKLMQERPLNKSRINSVISKYILFPEVVDAVPSGSSQ